MNLSRLIQDPLLCLFLEETSKPKFISEGVYFEVNISPFNSTHYIKFEIGLALLLDEDCPWELILRREEYCEGSTDMAVVACKYLQAVSYEDLVIFLEKNENCLLKENNYVDSH
jgi:hypothetical protein